MLKLLEVIPIKKEDLSKYKLHLAINPGGKTEDDPFDALFRGEFKDWQEWQKRKNFERDYILSLIDYHRPDEWVFGGVYKRKSVQKEEGHYKYHTELLDFKKDLIGRLIIFFRDRKSVV